MKAENSAISLPLQEGSFSAVQDFVQKGVSKNVFPGAVILTAAGGRILFLNAFGRLDTNVDSDPVTINTIFDLASLTKPLATSMAILCLVSDFILEWHTPLSQIFETGHDSPLLRANATVYHLLCHSSGLPSFRPFYYWLKRSPQKNPKNWVRHRILKEPLISKPGEKILYSDLNFMLLEWVVEKISSQPIHTFLQNRIYGPLGLSLTGFFSGPVSPFRPDMFASTGFCRHRRCALQGIVNDRNAFAVGGTAGHAGLFSTAPEIHTLLYELYRAYKGESDALFSCNHVRSMFTQCKVLSGNTRSPGFDVPSPVNSSAGECFSRDSVGHLGYTGVSFWIDLESGINIIMLTNRTAAQPRNTTIRSFRPLLHNLAYRASLKEMGKS